MKKHIMNLSIAHYILFLTTIFILSCEGFLDQFPENTISVDQGYKSINDFDQAVTALYTPLREIYNNEWKVSELRSDNSFFVFDAGQRGPKPEEDLATFSVETNNRNLSRVWSQNYLIISRSNYLLHKLNESNIDGDKMDVIKGEALFLRSLAYFNLIRYFGDVPLYLDPVENYSSAFVSRTLESKVYDQIIEDLQLSIRLLPSGYGEYAVGRANADGARALLGDIYITLKDWVKATEILLPIMENGYTLLDNYDDIFNPKMKDNPEILFQVNFLDGTDRAMYSTFPYAFLPHVRNPEVFTGVSGDPENRDGSFNVPTKDFLESYEDIERDVRYDNTISFYSGSSPIVNVTYENFPYINKFNYPHSFPSESDMNWIIYRFAEVQLMIAEALNEQGKTSEALVFLNNVRIRAGLDPVFEVNKESLQDIIFRERRIELAFENKRWHDLVRSDDFVNIMSHFGENVIKSPQDYYYPQGEAPPNNAFKIDENKKLYPIPISEIEINPDLSQNPGY